MSASESAATSIYFSCGHCGTKLRVPVELAGETGPCPRCALVITAPLVSSVPGGASGSQAGPAPRVRTTEVPEPIPGPVYEPPLSLLAGGWERRGAILRPAEPAAPGAMPEPDSGGVARSERTGAREAVAPDQGRPAGGIGGWAAPENMDVGARPAVPRPLPRRGGGAGVVWAVALLALVAGGGFAGWKAGLWEPGALTALLDPPPAPPSELRTGTAPGGTVVEVPVVTPVASLAMKPVPDSPAVETTVPKNPEPVAPKEPGAKPAVSDPDFFTGPPQDPGPKPEAPMGPQIRREGDAEGDAAQSLARAAVRKFLEAPSWRERVDTVWTRGDASEVLAAYYAERPDLAVQHYRLDFFHREDLPDGGSASVFFLTYSGDSDGFPILVRNRGEDYRLDWDLFVEFRERTFQRFVEERPEIPGRFRLVMQRVTYLEPDREEIPDSEAWLCYRLDPPYPGWTRYAFVAKGSPDGAALAREVPFEAEPLAAEVELGWETFPNGKRYLAIRRLVAKGWSGTGA